MKLHADSHVPSTSATYNRGWNKLTESNGSYKYKSRSVEKQHCTARLGFAQLAFDHDEECLIVVDTKGYLHCVELSETVPYCKRLGKVGLATFLAFNPMCKGEVLIGLDTSDIKIWKLHADVDKFSLLSGHKLPPAHISFYKSYCLTCSPGEVIIWHSQSYNKLHQLKVNAKNVIIRKAAFSSYGHIAVLYHNDTIQAWMFKQLDRDTKIDTKLFGMNYVKDFVFTKDGRTAITAGARNICVLSTYDWRLLRKLHLPKDLIQTKRLSVVPRPLDGGANKIVALLSSRCTVHFCDINTSSFLETPSPISRVRKFAVSTAGRYIAHIDQEGDLNLTALDKIISDKYPRPKKLSEPRKPCVHKISDHLECVRQSMKRELDVKRLMPILKEFGEYPEKYRTIIWSTILKLPANKDAYLALSSKVTRGRSARNMLKNYCLADKSKASLLAMTMDCLLQWCPLFAQSSFLPNLVFPFLMVFQKDPLLAFELILSILLNYCQNWFEYHPLPPLNILGIIENVLLEADPALLNIFCEHGVTTSEYAWPLLQTAMSEVLSGDEWLILWDYLITFQKPSLLLLCVVAYSIYSRENIISLVESSKDVKAFYSTQGHVRAKDLLKIARRLDQEVPERVHPNRYLREKLLYLSHTGPYPLFILKEYPKFLTENFCITDSQERKAREQCSREYNREVAESTERRRLYDEVNAFTKQIHEARLKEVQRCFQEHISNLNWKLTDTLPTAVEQRLCCEHPYKDHDSQSESIQTCKTCRDTKDESLDFVDNKLRNCEKLQQDVTKLEYEVQNFLDSLRSGKSRESCS